MDKVKSAGYEPVMLHVPGLTEATDKVWTLHDYVEWLKEKLGQEQEAILIGHSNGGRIALAFAEKYPAKLKQLVLIDSAGIYQRGWLIRTKRAVFGAVARLGKKITSSQILRKIMYALAGAKDYKNASVEMRQTMKNLILVDLRAHLPNISMPTLIIWGARDKATPLSDGKLMHEKIKGSEFFVIDEAGHSPQLTHAGLVSKKILNFVKKDGF